MNYIYTGASAELLTKVIQKSLKEYLGEEPAELIFLPNTDPVIFGGAIRDTIAGQKIQDVDVLCGPESFAVIGAKLIENKYTCKPLDQTDYNRRLFGLVRFVKGESTIDLIRLRMNDITDDPITPISVKHAVIRMLQNVDIRACGVGYSTRSGLLEFIEGAVNDCLVQQIVEQPDAALHLPGRVVDRIKKLQERGWYIHKHKQEIPTSHGF